MPWLAVMSTVVCKCTFPYRLCIPRLPFRENDFESFNIRRRSGLAYSRQDHGLQVPLDTPHEHSIHLFRVSLSANIFDASVQPLKRHSGLPIPKHGLEGLVELLLGLGVVLLNLGISVARAAQVLDDELLRAAVWLERGRPRGQVDDVGQFAAGFGAGHGCVWRRQRLRRRAVVAGLEALRGVRDR